MNKPTLYTRDFLVASFANFLFFSNINAFNLLPLYIKDLGGTEAQIGGIMGMYQLAAIFMQPLAGVVIDRLGRRWFMVIGAASALVASSGFGFSNILVPTSSSSDSSRASAIRPSSSPTSRSSPNSPRRGEGGRRWAFLGSQGWSLSLPPRRRGS
ncbi:MAG: MFS transporter [candidate division NC10 bacterium]|nr:MFS transporter [candidate division NC10 bacterium]